MTECFGEAECYRIGGDEFCVVAEGVQEEFIKESCKKVQDALTEKSKNLDYDIMTAMGYSKVEQGNLDECFNNADALMYENKKLLKQDKNNIVFNVKERPIKWSLSSFHPHSSNVNKSSTFAFDAHPGSFFER